MICMGFINDYEVMGRFKYFSNVLPYYCSITLWNEISLALWIDESKIRECLSKIVVHDDVSLKGTSGSAMP